MQSGVKTVYSNLLGGVTIAKALCIFNIASCYQTHDEKECS